MVGLDPEMLQMFLEESMEHLTSLEPDLLTLEETKDNPEKELINRIFRAVHSLKGSAGFFGFENVTHLSHIMENLLSLVRDGKLKPTSFMITTLLSGTDKLNQMISDVDNSDSVNIEEVVKNLDSILKGDTDVEKTVTLKLDGQSDLPDKIAKQFEISVSDLKKAVSHGHFLYAVHAYTNKDMKRKDKTPLDYLKNIEKMGTLIGSYSDFSSIGGLNDDMTSVELAFVYLFSSVLEPDLIALGLEVDENQIQSLEFPEFVEKEYSIIHESAIPMQKDQSSTLPPPPPPPLQVQPEKIVQPKIHVEQVKEVEVIEELPKEVKEVEIIPEVLEDAMLSTTNKKEATTQKETLRVSVALLNDLMTFAGELVLARNQLLRMASDVAKNVPGLSAVLQDIDMTTSVLQEKIMNTRMQPIALVFNKFPRLIRDLGSKLNKKIQLDIIGNEVDLDKSIIENLSDPLTHLIRNSADHAIELPEERKRAGKPETGTITLKAYHEGGKVNIDVVDDGKGIDPKVVLKKAIEKGTISEADAKRLTEKQVLELIFAAGFSTASEVSDVSGRGVGMDVVRTNIEKLGGSVSIDSKVGQGTSVNLKLPLTLAIIPSLIVKVQSLLFALPQVALRELVRLKKGDTHRKIEKVNDAPVLRLRNKLLPILYLSDVLGLTNDKDSKELEIIRVLILQHDDNEFGLVVDEVKDSEEIVVKSIPRFFKHSQCYSGTTIMGDGTVALILDISGIANKSKLNFTGFKEKSKSLVLDEESKVDRDLQNLLLFENAEEEYFALNLDLIKRIERVELDEVEKVGDKEYMEHEGKSLRVIRLEHFLPVRSREKEAKDLYVIIPKLIENPIGIISHRIIDSILVDVHIDTENITAKGLIGSALINSDLVLFPDIYEIVEMAEPEKAFKLKNNKNSKYKILLVEDTPFFRTLEKQYFESAGYKVDIACDGMEAMKKLTVNKYDILVVDIIMPRMDGYELVETLRKNPDYDNVPILALTTLANEENKQKAKDVGFDAYEVKVHKDKLMETVKLLLESDRNA